MTPFPLPTYVLGKHYGHLAGEKAVLEKRLGEARKAGDARLTADLSVQIDGYRRQLDAVHRQVRA
jgi:hypothetical protein